MMESKSKKRAIQEKSIRIGVVIVNYNSGELLGKCVQSLLWSRIPVDIVIVDNDSLDDSLEYVIDITPGIHSLEIIENTENRGFACAVNQGVLALENRFVMMLNPDCTIFPGTLLKLQKVMVSNREIAIAGATVFNEDGSEQRGCRRNEPTLKRSMITALGLGKRYQGIDLTWNPLPKRPEAVDAVSGAAMIVRREYFDQVGGMDEDFFLHCEDLDLCRRMREHGYLVVFCPNVAVFHRQGASGHASTFTVERHKHRGMLIYNRKHRSRNSSMLEKIAVSSLIHSHFWLFASVNYVRNALETFLPKPKGTTLSTHR